MFHSETCNGKLLYNRIIHLFNSLPKIVHLKNLATSDSLQPIRGIQIQHLGLLPLRYSNLDL
jgi:hypothetical protein